MSIPSQPSLMKKSDAAWNKGSYTAAFGDGFWLATLLARRRRTLLMQPHCLGVSVGVSLDRKTTLVASTKSPDIVSPIVVHVYKYPPNSHGQRSRLSLVHTL